MNVPVEREIKRDSAREREGESVAADGGGWREVGPFSWLIGWVYLHVLAA